MIYQEVQCLTLEVVVAVDLLVELVELVLLEEPLEVLVDHQVVVPQLELVELILVVEVVELVDKEVAPLQMVDQE
jgi:hypothetical protein